MTHLCAMPRELVPWLYIEGFVAVCINVYLISLVWELSDDNSGLALPTTLPLCLALTTFACLDAAGSIATASTAVTVACSVALNDGLTPHGYATPPLVVCRTDGVCC